MKKFLSLVLALVMTMSLVTISAGAKDFTDADKVNYDEAIAVLSAVKVIDGYTDGSFKPQTPLNRGQAAKIICNLVLGPTTAAELSATVAPFSDVPANNIFAGYITYCANEGIICGYGDGTFRPTGSLTGYAFLKMLLGALGYDAEIEGYNNPGSFGIQVAKQAIGIGLNKGLKDTFNGNKTVTREEACLYALNTLKATMVEYDQKIVANVNGAQVTVGTSLANEVKWNIAASTDGNIKKDGYVQFAEKYFPKLELEITNGMYGRPANTWKNKKAEIGTFTSIEPTYVYTESTKQKDVYSDLGKAVVDEYTWEFFVNGMEVEEPVYPANKSGNYTYTGEGVVTEIYVDVDNETVTLVEINNCLGQVTRVKTDDDGKFITVKPLSTEGKILDDHDFYVEGYEEDDYVVFTLDYDEDEDDFVIGEVFEPQTVTGEVKRVEKNDKSDNSYLKLADGEKYEYSEHNVYDVDDLTKGQHPDLNKEYILYRDPNGYVLGFELAEDEVAQYLYVQDSDEELKDWVARVVLPDATNPKIDLKKGLKSADGKTYTYFDEVNAPMKTVVNENAQDVTYATKDAEIEWVLNKDTGKDDNQSNIDGRIWKYSVDSKDQYTLTWVDCDVLVNAGIKNGKAYIVDMTTKDADNNIIVDKKTVFVDVKGEKSYIGYKEVPNIDNAKLIYVAGKDAIADVVFIVDGDIYDENATYFVLSKDSRESGKAEKTYWEFSKAYVNGEKTKLMVTYDAVEKLETAVKLAQIDVDDVLTYSGKNHTGQVCLKEGVLYKAVKTIEDGEYIDEIELVGTETKHYDACGRYGKVTKLAGGDESIGDGAFWINTGKKVVRFDADEETEYVVVREVVDKEGKSEIKVESGSIKDLKDIENTTTTRYTDKAVHVVKVTNDETARLVYIFWTETDIADTKDVTVEATNATVEVNGATVANGKTAPVVKGKDAKLTIVPATGYEITKVTVNGVEVKLDENGEYTIENVTKDQKVVVKTAEIVVPTMTIKVTYTANDDAIAEKLVKAKETDAVDGFVTVTAEVPTGYKLSGKLTSKMVAFEANGKAEIEFKVELISIDGLRVTSADVESTDGGETSATVIRATVAQSPKVNVTELKKIAGVDEVKINWTGAGAPIVVANGSATTFQDVLGASSTYPNAFYELYDANGALIAYVIVTAATV